MRFSQSLGPTLASALACALVSCGASLVAQTTSPPSPVTPALDETNLITLRGNTLPLALPQFEQGAAPDDLPMQRMLLLLRRSNEQ
jgi:hypothetical protein